MKNQPRILNFTGDGKGKTTAGLGLCLRALGHGKRVRIIQFVKSDDKIGELTFLQNQTGVKITQHGCGFIPSADSPKFVEHKNAAGNALEVAREEMKSGQWDVVMLDEINVAVAKDLLAERDTLNAIADADAKMTIVLTGRYATEGLLEIADTVTEMRCVKHGFKAGIPAQQGVEF